MSMSASRGRNASHSLTNGVAHSSGIGTPGLAVPQPVSSSLSVAHGATERDDETGCGTARPGVPIPDEWATPFVKEWLALRPRLADIDMRGALYVSREYLPVLTTEDGLSSTAAEILEALV